MLRFPEAETKYIIFGDRNYFKHIRAEEHNKLFTFLTETAADTTWQFSRVIEFIKDKWPQRPGSAVYN
ncbi:MAG: hypothetical protein HGA76_03180 [Candidatus Firestonebacteria bacterium]|nr:hypothetical protein [Candidatus Firestonebacteria bacterium]